jgi:hypothetical protein
LPLGVPPAPDHAAKLEGLGLENHAPTAPAVTSGEDSDETGIIVAGLGADGRAYILEESFGLGLKRADDRAKLT